MYLIGQIGSGKSVNNFEIMLTFKTDGLIKDYLRKGMTRIDSLSENVYSEQVVDLKGNKTIPEFIKTTEFVRLNLRDSVGEQEEEGCYSLDNSPNSLTCDSLEFFKESVCLRETNNQLKYSSVINGIVAVLGNQSANIYESYINLTGTKVLKVKSLACEYGLTQCKVKTILRNVESALGILTNKSLGDDSLRNHILESYEMNRYKDVDDYTLSDLMN
jgi:hypothetical protein